MDWKLFGKSNPFNGSILYYSHDCWPIAIGVGWLQNDRKNVEEGAESPD